jgi:hypothetical protein
MQEHEQQQQQQQLDEQQGKAEAHDHGQCSVPMETLEHSSPGSNGQPAAAALQRSSQGPPGLVALASEASAGQENAPGSCRPRSPTSPSCPRQAAGCCQPRRPSCCSSVALDPPFKYRPGG